jgi:hypothetical protein
MINRIVVSISALEIIFCAFLAENNFVNALILFIRVRTTKKSPPAGGGEAQWAI